MLRDTFTQVVQPLYTFNGVLMYFDPDRQKWLSVGRQFLNFGLDNKNIGANRWLSVVGKSYSNTTGYRLIRNATITAVSIQTQHNTNCMFSIKKNFNAPSILDIILNNETGKEMDNLNFDLDKGDILQVLIESGSNLNYPELLIEFAWRRAD